MFEQIIYELKILDSIPFHFHFHKKNSLSLSQKKFNK